MKRLLLLFAPILMAAALGCGEPAYEPPPETIPNIPPGRGAEGGGGPLTAPTK